VLLCSCQTHRPVFEPVNASNIDHIRKAAEQGDAKAQYRLGIAYDMGQGVGAPDRTESTKWYRKAAEQGLANAQLALGFRYIEGQGVQQDYTEAKKWLRKVADKGDAHAQWMLGWAYSRSGDATGAIEWYRRGADQGDEFAQVALGNAYSYGMGVPRNETEAIKWYCIGTLQGHTQSRGALSTVAINSRYVYKVPADFTEAIKWLHKVAEQDDASAQCRLAVAYARGQGITPDYAEAYKWLLLSETSTTKEWAQFSEDLMRVMTPEQITEGKNRAAKFAPKKSPFKKQ
jgi:TPR repeat protein